MYKIKGTAGQNTPGEILYQKPAMSPRLLKEVSRNHYRKDSDLYNKAGYTATSCGRVGRGGNARFPTFRLDHYGPTDGPTDGQSLL